GRASAAHGSPPATPREQRAVQCAERVPALAGAERRRAQAHLPASRRGLEHAGIQQRENVRMLQPGGYPYFQQEALGAQAGGENGLEDLERDRAVMPQVVSEV